MQKKYLKWAKNYHKWPALVISLFLILFSVSGIIMNHRDLFSGVNIGRKWLPASYRLDNWNLASVRSQVRLKDGNILIYGNIGIWKTDSAYSQFSDFNSGLGKGMDRRKVRIVTETPGGSLLAGTMSGLYSYSAEDGRWEKISTGRRSGRIQDIVCQGNRVIVLGRSELYVFPDTPALESPATLRLRAPAGYDNKMSLFRFAWITHSGEIAGTAGRLFLDLLALLIIFLVITGLIYFFLPKIMKKRGNSNPGPAEFRGKNLYLHNKTGAWFLVFLAAIPLTGMFLRPPFLITIAYSRIPVLPLMNTGLNNPWEDKFRAVAWSPEKKSFIFSTSDGFFLCDSTLSAEPVRPDREPPVSVMGINVLEYSGNGCYVVGSFDGLYSWNPLTGEIIDLSGSPHSSPGRSGRGRPSGNLVSGMLKTGPGTVIFDYDRGAVRSGDAHFPPMPGVITGSSPMALWNAAQEIHTGRIYQPFLGPFYILVVPLIALLTILVLITGYLRWRKLYRGKESSPKLR